MYPISTTKAPKAEGAMSQGSSAARTVYISAQIPQDPVSQTLIKGSAGAKCVRCLLNIDAILDDAGLSLQDVCEMRIYLTNMDDLAAIDEVLAERIPKPYPARTVLGVAALPHQASMAIECTACR